MKKSIIIEGPNGSFKSTLGSQLSKDLKLVMRHAGPNPGDTADAVKACMSQLSLLKRGCIMDRCTPISRPIYDHDCIPEIELIIFNKRLQEMMMHATIIFCTGKGDFTNKGYYPEGHYEKILGEKDHIRALYAEYMEGIDHLVYNGKNYVELLRKLQ